MRVSRMKLLTILGILVLTTLIMAGCATAPREQNVGVIDLGRIILESPRAQHFQNQLDQRGAQIQERFQGLQDANLSGEEQLRLQEEAVQEFLQAKNELEDQLNSEIEQAIEQVAKNRKINVVFTKENVRYGGIDITQEIINRLQ